MLNIFVCGGGAFLYHIQIKSLIIKQNMDSGITPEIQVGSWLLNNILQEITNAF